MEGSKLSGPGNWITRFSRFCRILISSPFWKANVMVVTAHLCQKHMQKWFNLWLIIFLFSGLANPSCQIWTFLWIQTENYEKDWNPGNENMLQVGDDVNCDPGPCSSGRTPPINYLLQLCTLTKIKGRKIPHRENCILAKLPPWFQ